MSSNQNALPTITYVIVALGCRLPLVRVLCRGSSQH
jgi:hypothetical protein